MGDVDQPGADMLDERMWGDEEDEEEGKDGEEEKKKKEEFGEGKGEESRTDMVAKDDNQGIKRFFLLLLFIINVLLSHVKFIQ